MRLDKALEKAIFEFKQENEISPKMWYQIYRLRERAKGVEYINVPGPSLPVPIQRFSAYGSVSSWLPCR